MFKNLFNILENIQEKYKILFHFSTFDILSIINLILCLTFLSHIPATYGTCLNYGIFPKTAIKLESLYPDGDAFPVLFRFSC